MENNKKSGIISIILLTISGCFIYAVACGIKNNYGIMLSSIVENAGMTFASVSFVLAVGQLIFGVAQPLSGMLAAKKSNFITLISGIILIIIGLFLLPFCKSSFSLMIVLGFILPIGTGALSFGVIMGAITPKLSGKSSAFVSGIVNASSGIGNTVMSPIIHSVIAAGGLMHGMIVLAVTSLFMIPFSLIIGGGRKRTVISTAAKAEPSVSIKDMFANAFKSKNYIYLMIGFFTCGFHMALITNHLPTQITTYGYTSEAAANAFAMYGIATMLGCLLSGSLSAKFKMKKVLGSFYLSRAIITLVFFVLPKTFPIVCLYVILLGFTGAATVSPVSGLVGKEFGAKSMAMLFGFVFLVHQIGSFFSAWLGGICIESTGSYSLIWTVDIVFCVIAAVVSYIIKEKATN
ncbi:MAG: MFS transporter [Clostridiales bacterium]|nr:MFS transporter [Clostridiales bacterium]